MASPHIIDALEISIRKVSFNSNKGRLSLMNLRSPGQLISAKEKYRIPFSEPIQWSVRGNLVHSKKNGGQKFSFHVSFRVSQCSDASTQTP